jgi:hypothetical protein
MAPTKNDGAIEGARPALLKMPMVSWALLTISARKTILCSKAEKEAAKNFQTTPTRTRQTEDAGLNVAP